jgi:DNA-binding XRE family transcriptional regulator
MTAKGLTNSQKKDWAKTLIVKEKLNQKEAALRVGVSTTTMNKWFREENWEKLQKNFILTRAEQMAFMLEELVEINEAVRAKPEGSRYADSKLGDVRRKLVKDIKELETKAAVPEIIHSCILLLEFIRKIDLEKAQELSQYVDAFIKSKL